MAKGLGFRKIALATDPFQTQILKSFIKRRCDNIDVIPIVFPKIDSSKSRVLSLPKINLQTVKKNNFVALPDREGFWKRLMGTLGNHINYK
jgi:hypothetical protein